MSWSASASLSSHILISRHDSICIDNIGQSAVQASHQGLSSGSESGRERDHTSQTGLSVALSGIIPGKSDTRVHNGRNSAEIDGPAILFNLAMQKSDALTRLKDSRTRFGSILQVQLNRTKAPKGAIAGTSPDMKPSAKTPRLPRGEHLFMHSRPTLSHRRRQSSFFSTRLPDHR